METLCLPRRVSLTLTLSSESSVRVHIYRLFVVADSKLNYIVFVFQVSSLKFYLNMSEAPYCGDLNHI